MKRTLLAAVIIMACSLKTFAQDNAGEFKPFKVDVSIGYAIPSGGGSGAKGGFLFAVEPKYAIMPELSLGLRIEAAATVSGIDATGNFNNTASVKASASYVATGDYYFSNNDFRPFAGAGLGIFSTAGASINSNNSNVASGSKFGGLIRAGFEYKHFRMGLEYNLVGKTTVAPSSANSNDGYDVKNSYIGIKIGVCIGGGRR